MSLVRDGRITARRIGFVLLATALAMTGRPMVEAQGAEDLPPVLGGQLFSTGGQITIEVLPATAGLTSTLYLMEPERVRVATNRDVGSTVVIGPYGSGEELVFGIDVGGQEFRLGPGARNPDGIEHGVVDFAADGCALVGFEDLFGGGDRDYDDNRFRFCGGIAAEVPEDPVDPPTPDPVSTPVADAGSDQSVPEGSTVTLDGSASTASTKPALQESREQGTLPGGTSIGATLSGLAPDVPGLRVTGAVDLGQGPAAQNTSIAYVLDVSGSTGGSGCGGDINHDNRTNTILDCEIAAAIKLHETIAAAGTVDKVAVVRFDTGAAAIDLDPTTATATLVSPDADKDNDGEPDVIEGLKTLRILGGTNFVPAARTACQLLATTGSPNLVSAFLSDGQQNSSLTSTVPCTPPVTFHAFAVGSGSRCASGAPVGARLLDLATRSGGTCTDVPTVTDLPEILPQVVASQITSVSYTVDGGDPADLSAQLDLPQDGPTDLEVAFDLPQSLAAGSHEICLTVTGKDSGGTSSQTTCSDLVTVTGEVSYSWRQVGQDGPPVFVSSRTGKNPTFVAPDDGRYVFELTVTDGTGGTATDRVVVEVANVDPTLDLTHGDSFAGGVTQVNATLTDEGWLDSHSATVAWGDGTTDQVTVSTAGPGWGTFFGSHVYRTAGSYDVVVTLTDDDGGTRSARVDHLEVASPVAVWANAPGSRSLDWAGGSGEIRGRVHTNGELRFVGASKTVMGPSTYAGSLSADTTRNSFQPLPVAAAVQDFPFRPEVADFRPGGPVSVEVGAAFHDMTSSCASGTWHEVQVALPSGVYYAPCDIQLNGSQIGGRVTLVSEGHIKIAGSKPAFQPFHDGLLLLAGASGTKAIDVATSSSKFLGVVFAGSGQVSISGATNEFYCGVLGHTVSIGGTDVTVRGAACGRPDRTVSGPVVVPDLRSSLAVDRDVALPSDALAYDVTVTNAGTTVVVPSLIGLENVDAATVTVTGHEFVVERQNASTGQWVPFAASGDPDVKVDLRANAFPGVTYPASSGISGTTVAPGGWATWGLQAVLSLTPPESELLLDVTRTSGVRTRVDFTLTPSTVQTRRLYTFGSDFSAALRALGADATGVGVTQVLPDGETLLLPGDADPQVDLGPGESVTYERAWTVPVPAPRGPSETDAGYLSRLVALDGTQLNGAAHAVAQGGVGRLVSPLRRVSTDRQLPVVAVSTVGTDAVPAGTSADYDVKLANLGSVDASALEVKAYASGTALPVSGAPTGLPAGALEQAATTYAAPAASSGTVVLRGTAEWTDDRGNAYGVTGSDLAVERQVPAVLGTSLVDSLVGDVGNDGAVSPGDTVRYTLVVRNGGGLALTGVTGSVPVPRDATLVLGSIGTPDGGQGSAADGAVTFTLPDITGSGSRRVVFDVVVDKPFADGVSRLEAQGTVSATGLTTRPTDDPALPGAEDPTRTTVTRPTPALVAGLTGRLAIDADGSGGVSPGDTLAYSLSVSSVGTQQVTGIVVAVPAPAGTSLVEGSVTTRQGTPVAGIDVRVQVGTLAPFQEDTIGFRLKVADPLPAGTTSITTTGTIISDQLDPITTDDPQTVTVGDGTSIPIGGGGGNPEFPSATVGGASLVDGQVVTQPVEVTATLTPPAGARITSWTVDYRVPGEATTTVIGTGTSTSVSADLDPTKMRNGAYVVTVRATSSNGGVTAAETTVVIDGQMKLGRYTTTFNDMTVGLGGVPFGIERTYDSFEKSSGDFGFGWSLDLADFRVSTNGPLGSDGWTMQGCGGGLIFSPLCFSSTKAHFVTVTWPDGRTETFDLTPAAGSTFFSGLTTAQFTGREGATSTLTAPDNSLYLMGADLNGGLFGSDGVYNPTQFVLTDRSGTKYTLQIGVGMTRMEDTTGHIVTVTDRGVSSNRGPGITFDRDPQGRVTVITDPAGKQARYAYDAAGDLVKVTDRDGSEMALAYAAGHLLLTTNPVGRPPLRTMHYDADGRLDSITDGAGNTVSISVDPDARIETVTGPDPRLTTVSSFDAKGNLAQVDRITGGRTLTSTFTYNDLGLVETSTDPLGKTSRASYDAKGNLKDLVDRDGVRTAMTYNDKGQPVEQRVGGVLKTKIAYDALTGLPERIDYGSTGDFIEMEYDGSGRLLSSRDTTGRVETNTYGSGFVPLTTTGPEGTTSATYDALGNLETVTDATGATLRYAHDELGQLTAFTDGNNHTSRYRYDAFRRLIEETDALGRSTVYTYDAAGRLRTVTDRNGDVTTMSYAPDGQVTRREATDGTFQAFTYDASGRLKSAANGLSNLTWEWDDANQPVQEIADMPGLPAVAVGRSWTAGGQLAGVSDPYGSTSYGYDDQGRLQRITGAGGASVFSYDTADRVTSMTRPNGLSTAWTYAGGLIQQQETSVGGEAVQTSSVTRDPSGRPEVITDQFGAHVLQHDDNGQITSVDHPASSGIADESYTYDRSGNRTSWAGNAASLVAYDLANRLLSDGEFTYTYDREGRLLTRTARAGGGVTRLEWNDLGQLVRVTPPSGPAITYSYDALGRRIETAVGTDATRTVYAGDNPLLRYSGSVLEARFDNGLGADGTVSVTSGGATRYPLADDSGTVTAMSDSAGAITGRFGFDSFGNPAAGQAAPPSDAFHGFEVDPTGMYDARARTYDPGTGRFLSEDPLASENAYPYAVNAPDRVSDPSGMTALVEYSATTTNSSRSALAICTQGSFWASFMMDTAVELAVSSIAPGTPGIYAFWDEKAGKPYVGRSVDLMKRLNSHLRAGRVVDKSQIKLILNVTKEMLPNVEQLAISRCNGGKAVGEGASQLANKINAINKSRRDKLSSLNSTLEGLL